MRTAARFNIALLSSGRFAGIQPTMKQKAKQSV
jgi:hypothetical protein